MMIKNIQCLHTVDVYSYVKKLKLFEYKLDKSIKTYYQITYHVQYDFTEKLKNKTVKTKNYVNEAIYHKTQEIKIG